MSLQELVVAYSNVTIIAPKASSTAAVFEIKCEYSTFEVSKVTT